MVREWRAAAAAMVLLGGLFWAQEARAARVYEPHLGLRLEERYDDDPRLAGTEGGQLMTKVTPRVGLEVKEPTLLLVGSYTADLLVRHGSGTVTLDHHARLRGHKALSRRLRLELEGGLHRVTDSLSLPRESVARSSDPILYGQLRVGGRGWLSRRVEVRASWRLEQLRVLSEEQLSGGMHAPSAEAWWRASRRLSLGVEYRYQAFFYDTSSSQAHGAFGAMELRPSRNLVLTARAGPVLHGGSRRASALVPRVLLELVREGTVDLSVSAGRDVVGASGLTDAVWADWLSLSLSRRFNSRLSAYAALQGFRNGRLPGDGGLGAEQLAHGYALGAGVELRLHRALAVQGAVNHVVQAGAPSLTTGMDMTRNVFALRLVLMDG